MTLAGEPKWRGSIPRPNEDHRGHDNPRAADLAGPQEHSAYRPLHGDVADAVQGFLAE